MLAVLPLSSRRKSSPDNNMIICFCKIFYSPRAALRKEGPPLTVYLPGAIKYIDHASKLRAQCEAVLDKPGIIVHRQRGHHIASRKESRWLFCVFVGGLCMFQAREIEKRGCWCVGSKSASSRNVKIVKIAFERAMRQLVLDVSRG